MADANAGECRFASSLDQAGRMARSVEDCAIMLEAMAGSIPRTRPPRQDGPATWETRSTRPPRQAIGTSANTAWTAPIRKSSRAGSAARNGCADEGARSSISPADTEYARDSYIRPRGVLEPRPTTACAMGCASCRSGRSQDSTPHSRRRLREEVKRRVLIGTYVLSAGFTMVLHAPKKVRPGRPAI